MHCQRLQCPASRTVPWVSDHKIWSIVAYKHIIMFMTMVNSWFIHDHVCWRSAIRHVLTGHRRRFPLQRQCIESWGRCQFNIMIIPQSLTVSRLYYALIIGVPKRKRLHAFQRLAYDYTWDVRRFSTLRILKLEYNHSTSSNSRLA